MEHLQFPIGHFSKPGSISKQFVLSWIEDISSFPNQLIDAVKNLSIEQLNWKYRSDGWTIKQVVHHCVDSHINSYIRFKLALTEDQPKIRPYHEDLWADLSDSQEEDVADSLMLLQALHKKWVTLLNSLGEADLKREFIHPEHGQVFSLEENIGIYAWHGKHHLAHIILALESNAL